MPEKHRAAVLTRLQKPSVRRSKARRHQLPSRKTGTPGVLTHGATLPRRLPPKPLALRDEGHDRGLEQPPQPLLENEEQKRRDGY